MVLQKYCAKYLEHWKKQKKWDEKLLLKLIRENNMPLIKIQIKNKKVKVLKDFNAKHRGKREKAITFLQDVVKMYPKLDTINYLNLKDTLNYEGLQVYNTYGDEIMNYKNDDYHHGVSRSNKNIIRMTKSKLIKKYKKSFPVFCFETDRDMPGVLFPTFGADNSDFKKLIDIDPFTFEEKTNETIFFRGKNLCPDMRYVDKLEMINLALTQPNVYDFRMNMEEVDFNVSARKPSDNIYGGRLISEALIKLYQSKGILDCNKSYQEVKDYLVDNFVEFEDIFKHKLLLTVGSGKNRKWYPGNSCIVEYQFKNKEYFYEEIFTDMESIVYVDKDTIAQKLEKLRENDYALAKQITENRKKVFMEYLHYPNLVKWYGKFLLEYQKIKNSKK